MPINTKPRIIGTPEFVFGLVSPVFSVIPQLAFVSMFKRRTPQTGTTWIFRYEGTEAGCNAGYNICPADWIPELDGSGAPKFTLTVQTPDDPSLGPTSNVVATTFQVIPNQDQRELWEHPSVLAIGLPQIVTIRDRIRKLSYDLSGLTATGVTVMNLAFSGTTAFFKHPPVFRMTQTVTNRYQEVVSYANVDKTYTGDQLKTEVKPPAGIIISIDEVMRNPPAVDDLHTFGWLKLPPSVETAPNNRVVITQEWWLDRWAKLLNPAA